MSVSSAEEAVEVGGGQVKTEAEEEEAEEDEKADSIRAFLSHIIRPS